MACRSTKAITAPLAQVKFCSTGGMISKNVADYVASGCVATVSGTWMLPTDAIDAGDWATITA